MNDSVVIIPTYKEKENIEAMIRKVITLKKEFDILIVDDNSPDGTADIVKNLMKEYPTRLFILERTGKLGLGTAYLTGFEWALERGYEYVCEMDADFSHNPEDLVRLQKRCSEDADVVVGSRYVCGVNVVNWPIGRVIMSYFASVYVRKVTGMPIMDATAGFVCYSAKVLKAIDFSKIRMKGYGFQIEMKYRSYKLNFKIAEESIIFTDRTLGESKMSSGIFGEAFWGVLSLRFRGVK